MLKQFSQDKISMQSTTADQQYNTREKWL